MNIIQALDDPNVFGRQFHGGSWDAWRTFLAALFALPLRRARDVTPPDPLQYAREYDPS